MLSVPLQGRRCGARRCSVLFAAASLAFGGTAIAPAVAAQQATPAPSSPDQAAGRPARPLLPPRLAEVFLPVREWRLELSIDRFPGVGLRRSALEAVGGDVERGTSRAAVRLSAPALVRAGGTTIVLQDLSYERTWLEYSRPVASPAPSADLVSTLPGDLHALQYSVTVAQRLSPRWRLLAASQAALLSDLESVDVRHVRVTGQLLATRQVRPNLQWGAGVGWINVGPRIVPLVRVLWADGRGQRADVLLPSRAEYWSEMGGGVEVGAAVRLTGNRFSLGRANAEPYTAVEYTEGTISPAIAVRRGPIRLQVDGGIAAIRTLRLIGPNEVDRSISPQVGVFARASVRVGLP